MNFSLIKIEEGVCKGNVVHHEYIKLTPKEIKTQLDSLKNKRELKEKRKKEQEENVRNKAEKRGENLPLDPNDEGEAKTNENDQDDIKDEG